MTTALDTRDPSTRAPLTSAALDLLDRSDAELRAALGSDDAGERYVHAHLAALRAGAAVVAVRGRPTSPRRGGPRSVWEMLPRIAPDLEPWAALFAATAGRRAAVEAGRDGLVDLPSADALLHEAEQFHHVVESALGLTRLQPLAG
ncbi:SAV_6107 family HEPN domain-containing protein [Kineococcus rubinsiae]|uniref:SAV_6107 family HEPN domain-containing protein n=1 Tax=Kineococcus rubinsiae TaxID=2609562 RepID=UPI00142F4E61|nr:SAV_6107 family HEPN domain-containing protein [Kineococcus rubinsiae]NIZ92925.1 toprim domain-containing protein [Kineococcus rubinsiae]